jgi:putative SOS response-associated peptidase YedK
MCGRYTLARSQQELSERFGIKQLFLDYKPRYNLAPGQDLPVIFNSGGKITLESCQWGLIPSWVKDLQKTRPLINARAETVLEKPSFKKAIIARRCLVPADGFYEWKSAGSLKRPFFIHRPDSAIFAFAGIWDEWKNAEGVPVRTFSIITTQANKTMSAVHDRMPVILSAESEQRWLDPTLVDPAKLLCLLAPCSDDLITMHQVSTQVNSVKHDSVDLIEAAGGQLGLDLSI